MQRLLAFLFLLAAGCGGQLDNDGASDEAALARGGKSDAVAPGAASVAGIYQLPGDPSSAGDIVYLWLRADGVFAWTRCYDAGCATPVVEDGTYQLSTSSASSKKTYITFSQIGPGGDVAAHFNSMYAYSRTARSLRLRQVRTNRWITLAPVAEPDLCTASGGSWLESGGCNCGSGWPTAYSPGAGGCWTAPAVTEAACDATRGSWSDDDANAAGTFCDCGYGRHLEVSGCVANSF